MRLINTTTYKLCQFFQPMGRKYAILSHRWEEEISFAQFTAPNFFRSHAVHTKGWKKIQSFCQKARSYQMEWAWIDTCCIDKSSSAELSEAINSMYSWYANASVCLVFMSDVVKGANDMHRFEESKWFTRGWTLQELLAPPKLHYYDSTWEYLGTRKDWCRQVSQITNIPVPVLFDPNTYRIQYTSAAQRMSWVAQRRTTREEDIAYCLLGMFNVNMPLLYGEGAEKAFQRLQLEILSKSEDESIFAWAGDNRGVSVLARCPSLFSKSSDVRCIASYRSAGSRPSVTTPWGLSMHRPLYSMAMIGEHFIASNLTYQDFTPRISPETQFMPIACTHHGNPLAVSISQLNDATPVYGRNDLLTVSKSINEEPLSWRDLYVRCQGQLEPLPPSRLPGISDYNRIAHLVVKNVLNKPIAQQNSDGIFKALEFAAQEQRTHGDCDYFTIASSSTEGYEELDEGSLRSGFLGETTETGVERRVAEKRRHLRFIRNLKFEEPPKKMTRLKSIFGNYYSKYL